MFSNQIYSASRGVLGCAGLTLLLAIAGCSSGPNAHATDTTSLAVTPAAASDAAAAGPQTDTEMLGDAGSDNDTTTTVMSDAGPALKAGAPKDYVVKRGDTLWGIANMFLRDPWLWPEIWYVNPKIQNPHRIYPGDTVHLALSAATVVHRCRSCAASTCLAVSSSRLLAQRAARERDPTIPYNVIAAFLDRPGVLSRDEVSTAPYILALRGEHDIAGAGDEVYIKKLDAQTTGARYASCTSMRS